MGMKLRVKKVECEKCGKQADLEDICFVFIHWTDDGKEKRDKSKCEFWCTACQNESNPYWVALTDPENGNGFLDSAEEVVDTLQHLNHKGWFNAQEFVDKMDKLRGF